MRLLKGILVCEFSPEDAGECGSGRGGDRVSRGDSSKGSGVASRCTGGRGCGSKRSRGRCEIDVGWCETGADCCGRRCCVDRVPRFSYSNYGETGVIK